MAPFLLIGMWGDSMFLFVGIRGRALIGGIGGLNQHAIRGIVAYSSFVHTA